ncbi:MAG: hypothetical protein COC12_07020 [Rhodobacteraceae bacterium]|nr:MAG: hypothetical protein COC12_07020 [Paracoccaceae bacterium]
MPILDQAQIDQLAERRGTNSHVLLWVVARERTSGADQAIGFWTGDDHRSFQIGAETRLYYGAGNVIDVAPVVAGVGLKVRHFRVSLTAATDEVRTLLRDYDPRLAPVEVHVAPMDIDTGGPLGTPKRMIKGTVNKLPEEVGAKGTQNKLEMTITSNALALTRALPLLRSNEELQRRLSTARGREYADVAGEWITQWGVS